MVVSLFSYNFAKNSIIKSSWRKYHTEKTSRKLKVLFFGTDSFSLPSLESLYAENTLPKGSISRLDVCCFKAKSLVPVVQSYCEKNEITIHYWPPDVELCSQFDLGIVASFGKLIPSNIIQSFNRYMQLCTEVSKNLILHFCTVVSYFFMKHLAYVVVS